MLRILFTLLLLQIPRILMAQELTARDIDSLLHNKRIYRAENIGELHTPRINGVLDEEIWSLGEWQDDFIQQFPYSGSPATEPSWFKILYDQSNLYVALICKDSEPDLIVDRLGPRDSREGDIAGIALDSYFDKRTAFEFSITVAGQKMDVKHLGDWDFDFNWNAVWDAATSRTDTGWIAEIMLPFSQIRYADEEAPVWGLHFYRVVSRKQEASSWDPIPREAPATVYLFGELTGLENIRSSRQVEFLPYVLGSYSMLQEENPPGEFGFNAGLDAKVGIRSDFTLDLTVNPDFGQVEADPSVLNLTSFETFYEEKRPFFLEGNDVFDFELAGDIPYYSRRIGSAPGISDPYEDWALADLPDRTTILGAAKLSGKNKNGLSVGLVNGLTASAYGTAYDNEGSEKEIVASPLSNYLVSRIKRDFNQGNSVVGGILSLVNRFSSDSVSEYLLPSSAISGGLDLLHYWDNKNYFLEVKSIASQMNGSAEAILNKQLSHTHRFQRPDASYLKVDSLREHLGGHGALVRVGKNGGRWNFHLQGQYRSPGLNLNDVGYIRQADFIGEEIQTSYEMNEPKTWVRNYTIKFSQKGEWSFGGENTRSLVQATLNLRNNKLWRFNLNSKYEFSVLNTRELRGGPALRNDPFYLLGVSVESDQAKKLYGGISYDFSSTSMQNSYENSLMFNLTWMPVKRFQLSGQAHLWYWKYHQQYASSIPGSSSTEYVVGDIDRQTTSLTFRAELYLTPEMSLQYYGSPYYSVGDYENFRRVKLPHARDIEERLQGIDASYDPEQNSYTYLKDTETYSFYNPDFNFMQFRSNLVFRWEYKLGSTLYLVWSHDRSGYASTYHPVGDLFGDLFGLRGNNIFMVKANFWFSL